MLHQNQNETPQAPVTVSMPQVWFSALDKQVEVIHGVGFEELVVDDPTTAYNHLIRAVGAMSSSAIGLEYDGMSISAQMDGEETVQSAASKAVEEVKVDADIRPIDVVVSVFGKQKMRNILSGRTTAPVKVIRFHTEPPNLAF